MQPSLSGNSLSASTRYLYLTEILVMVFSCPFIIINVVSILRKNVFHRNLKVLLMGIPIAQFAVLTGRAAMLVALYAPLHCGFTNTLFSGGNIIGNYGLFSKALSLIVLSAERLTASFYSNRYENCGYPYPIFGLSLLSLQWIGASLLILLGYTKLVSLSTVLLMITGSYIGSFVIFATLPWATRKACAYKIKKSQNKKIFSLSERYQLAENVKCADDLNSVILIVASTEMIATVSLLVLSGLNTTSSFETYFLSGYYMFCTIQVVLFWLALTSTCRTIYISLKNMHKKRNGKIIHQDNLKTSYMSHAEEQQIYFDQFCKAWS